VIDPAPPTLELFDIQSQYKFIYLKQNYVAKNKNDENGHLL
jgi:hypothetical protein